MEEPGHGIIGRERELARVQSFIGSVTSSTSGSPDLPAPQKRALDAALLRAEVEGAPPDQRAVSVASLGVLRALATSGPVIVAVDDVQWLDVPSARVLAFVVRRLEDAPIRILVALRVGSDGDPLALGQTGPVPPQRVPIGPLPEEAMTRLLRARAEGGLTRPTLLRLHRISEGNPLFALEIARALTERGVRPAPGEPLPVPEDLQELLGARLAALPSSAADGLLIVAAAARPTEDLVVAAAERPDWASAGMRSAGEAGVLQRAGGRLELTHPLLGSTVYAEATPHARRSVHRRLAELVDDPEERARHLAWVGIYRGDLAFAAAHTSVSMDWVRRIADPAIRAESLSTFAMVEFLLGRPAQDLACWRRRTPIAGSEEGLEMEPETATAQLPGQVWRRIVIVAAMVSAMVGGAVAMTGRTSASEPGTGDLRVQAPWADPSCRELVALPKRGWVCERHRP